MESALEMGSSSGTAPTPSPKDCTALNDKRTCRKKDRRKVEKACSDETKKKCTNLCHKKKKKISATCKEACCGPPSPSSPPSPPPPPSPPSPPP
eukprot:scaffold41481_cov64-Phaeocystis_antarctica.AAC.1